MLVFLTSGAGPDKLQSRKFPTSKTEKGIGTLLTDEEKEGEGNFSILLSR